LLKSRFFKAQNAPKSFVAGLRPDPPGKLTVLPDPLAAFDSPTSKRGEGRGGEKRGKKGRVERKREERGEEMLRTPIENS